MENTNEIHGSESGFLPFDPIVLVQDVLKHWLLILLAALMVGVGSYIATDRSYEPVYRTSMTFVVTSRSSSSTVYANLTSTTNLATVFSELMNSSVLRKAVLEEMGASSFDGSISAAAVPETNLITVSVTASDPRTAFLMAKAIMNHHETVTYQVVDNVALEVLQSPTVPMAPTNRADASGQMERMMQITALAVCAVLLWVSFTRDKVRSGKEARKKLDCSYLGEIPHENKYKTLFSRVRHRKTSVLITNPVTSFRYVETIRKLRRRVEQHMGSGKVLMVTSLLENEGKSTVSVNLALSMAQKYSRVLLIECDLRKPACHALLNQKNVAHGLRDVLANKASVSDAIIHDPKSGLYLLLETRGSGKSGDLISSERMQALIKWARQEFDFIVLDLPPMAAVSDAENMMEYADASLMVVRQNAALAPALNKAIATLEGGKAKLLGCVLNNVYATVLPVSRGYGYGYGKYGHYGRYGHYGPYGAKSERPEK